MGCCFPSKKKAILADDDEIARVSANLIDTNKE